MQRAYAEVEKAFGGKLHVVFANAGVNGTWAPIADLEPDEWRKTHDINLFGTFLTLKYAGPADAAVGRRVGDRHVERERHPHLQQPRGGVLRGQQGRAGRAGKMAALELARDKIRVNVICPGAIETEIEQKMTKRHLEDAAPPAEFPAGRIPLTGGKPGSAEQVAKLVLFLASDASDHITGTEMWIDGGESLMQG
jgi:NAD(P)-dependent dehydrogenase (short-subunit alcohol dehydrogenase family)